MIERYSDKKYKKFCQNIVVALQNDSKLQASIMNLYASLLVHRFELQKKIENFS